MGLVDHQIRYQIKLNQLQFLKDLKLQNQLVSDPHLFLLPLKSKTEDFIGRENLIKRKENPQKKLVGLELIGKEIANHGDCVHIGRSQVGIVTSGCISPNLNKNIALCRIDVGHSEIGNDVEIGKIDGHQKRIPAKIVGFPHYDPKKTKVRS